MLRAGGAGQLGLGDTDDYALPQRFTNDSQVRRTMRVLQ